ncbi:hypothetical protein KV112_15090 [Mycolicibacter sp. MYC123]|uniref:Haemophore haem-binding domain-containing protein n=1 Tax=[Mycobacterium] zoologicum TaxID=2872311 RepID=A0ABU5YLX9_9MYCO|nr:hypothetical protein [Mycolicibacter sp. MYC123]MEB3051049.1 hypothetical protein [Mycolicibacter sp. MYC123]
MAAAVAVAALAVALTKTGATSEPTYTAAQKAEARTQLCDQYKLAVNAVKIETHIPDNTALARASEINGAAILELAAANPALAGEYRSAAQELAIAFRTESALGSLGSNDTGFQAAVDATNAKGTVMQELCGD